MKNRVNVRKNNASLQTVKAEMLSVTSGERSYNVTIFKIFKLEGLNISKTTIMKEKDSLIVNWHLVEIISNGWKEK